MMRPYSLHCRTLGFPEHPAIVFLHGFMGSGADWDPVMAQLSESHYCVAMDLPGHGNSCRVPISSYYTFEGAAASVGDRVDIASTVADAFFVGGGVAELDEFLGF